MGAALLLFQEEGMALSWKWYGMDFGGISCFGGDSILCVGRIICMAAVWLALDWD